MEIEKNIKILKKIEKITKNEWLFDRKYKYNIGVTYPKNKSVVIDDNIYKLKYFDGCFYPFCVKEKIK